MNGEYIMSDILYWIIASLFYLVLFALVIGGVIYVGIFLFDPLISIIKDTIISFKNKKNNLNGIDTGVCYEVIKVKNVVSTRRQFPLYCFLVDGKTGNIYQVKNGKRTDEVIFNYYEECNHTCDNCHANLTQRTCDYCGWISPDLIEMEEVRQILTEYGYDVR